MLAMERAPYHAAPVDSMGRRAAAMAHRLAAAGLARVGPRGWTVTSRGSHALGTFDHCRL